MLLAKLWPVLILDNRCVSSDLNELYARIINANRVAEAVYKTVDKMKMLSFLQLLRYYKHCSVQ
ncbi:MAG: hypothetical protein ACKERG_01410 [Candidatus Hodgkinia cicadicola]